jgi:nitroreductase
VADASHLLVICIEKSIDRQYIESYFERVHKVRGTAEEILEPFRQGLIDSFTGKTEDEIRNWAINQAYLAMGNLLTVCAVERIDSCPMEGFVPEAFEALLGLAEKSLEPVLLLPVGYRSESDMFSSFKKVRKKESEAVLYYDKSVKK